MKHKDYLQRAWQRWAIGLAGILLLLSPFLHVYAQTATRSIALSGAESTFAPALAQPMKMLQSIGVTAKEIQKQLIPRPQISVAGDGVVQNLGLLPLAGTQGTYQASSGISVAGDGIVRNIGLTAPKTP